MCQPMCQTLYISLLSDSCSVLATLFPPPSFFLPQTPLLIWQEFCFLSSCTIRLQWVPGHSFLPDNDVADELARQGALHQPSTISYSLPPLISRIHFSLFSDWKRTISSKFFDTQAPSVSTEELVLPCHARCVLSHLRCNGHSLLLNSYLSRIGRIENPSYNSCGHPPQDTSLFSALSRRGLFSPLALWRLSLSMTSGSGLGELPCFLESMVFRHAPIPRKGSEQQRFEVCFAYKTEKL